MYLATEQFIFSYIGKTPSNKAILFGRQEISILVGIVLNKNKVDKKNTIRVKIDTGACSTVFPAASIGIHMKEQDYIAKFKPKVKYHVGIVNNEKVKYYQHEIPELHIGKIKLTDAIVYITFDNRVNAMLMGMDILGLFDISISNTNCTIDFTETEYLANYTHNALSIGDPALIDSSDDYIDFTLEDLEANYVNKKLHN